MTEERKPRIALSSDPNCCCDEREEVKHIRAEDGRRGEKHIKETCEAKETRVYLEPPIQKDLVQEIIEQKCPAVCHRTTKLYKPDGSVEVVEEDVNNELKVVDRRVEIPAPTPAPTPTPAPAPTPTNFATKDDVDELKGAIESIGEAMAKRPPQRLMAQNMLEDNLKNVNKETWAAGIFLVAFFAEVVALGWVVFWY